MKNTQKTTTTTNGANVRIFSNDEKDKVFEMYKNGDQLPKIAAYLKVDFTPSEHKINEKTGKETGTAAYVTINEKKYGLKNLLFYLDENRAAIEYETSNYQKGGRPAVDKVEAAKDRFLKTIEEIVTIGNAPTLKNGIIDLNAVFVIAVQKARAADEAAKIEAAKKQEETRLYKEAVEGAKKLGCTPEEYIELKKSFAAKKAAAK